MTEAAPQKSPHRRCETDPDHVAWEQRSVPAVEAWERWRSCLPTWRRILWVFCSHALHSSYSLMDTALQPDACLRAHPRNCLSSLRSVVFCSPGCRSHGPVCSWPGGGRGGEERADSNSVTEACLVSPTDELSCFRWAFISRSDSVFTTFDTFGLISRPVQMSFMLWDVPLKNGVMMFWLCCKQIHTQQIVVSVIFSFLTAGAIIWSFWSQTCFYPSPSYVRLGLQKEAEFINVPSSSVQFLYLLRDLYQSLQSIHVGLWFNSAWSQQ